MAFICPPRDEASKRTKVLAELKLILETVKEKMAVPCVACVPATPALQNAPKQPSPPNVMVCYKIAGKDQDQKANKPVKETQKSGKEQFKLKSSKSRELRWGVMYVDCDCEKRNGLQDDCRRSDCQGSPECVTLPYPTCGPSEFSNAKHIEKKMQEYARLRKKARMEKEVEMLEENGHHRQQDKQKDTYQCFPATIKMEAAQMCVPIGCGLK